MNPARLLVLVSLLVGCGSAPTSPARVHAPVVGERALDPIERRELDDLIAWVGRVRGNEFRAPLDAIAADDPTVLRAQHAARTEGRPNGIRATFEALGLVPPGLDDAVALRLGYAEGEQKVKYARQDARLLLTAEILPSLGGVTNAARIDQLVVFHEVVHAYQHVALGETIDAMESSAFDVDRELAIDALVEGDAEFTTWLAASRAHGIDVAAVIGDRWFGEHLATSLVARQGDDPAASEIARVRRSAPHVHGAVFVASLYGDEGWELVESAFDEADALTSEQILHPDLFGTTNLREPLDPPGFASPGEQIDQTTLGEIVLRSYFRALGQADAARAAAGWAGDLVRTYRRADGTVATIWLATWDSIRDAVEAADAAAHLDGSNALGDARTVMRHQRAVLITTGLSDAESTAARLAFETYVYGSLAPLERWPAE